MIVNKVRLDMINVKYFELMMDLKEKSYAFFLF